MATDLEIQQTVVRMAEYNRLVDRYELSLSVKVKEDHTDLLITRIYAVICAAEPAVLLSIYLHDLECSWLSLLGQQCTFL